MSFPITPRSVEGFPSCKDRIRWYSSSAAVVIAPRTGASLNFSFSSILSSKPPIAGCSPISTDNITETSKYRTGVGAHWSLLSSAGRVVQKDLDIAGYTDPFHNRMAPHVIVLEPSLVVYKIYNGYWFFDRPTMATMEDLRQDLRVVLKKCPDWDIMTPEMKAAWQQGRKELFYPIGKTFAQTLGEHDSKQYRRMGQWKCRSCSQ